ncbi:MAG TPA: ABC transporter permease [Anaerolineaceae bacterium]
MHAEQSQPQLAAPADLKPAPAPVRATQAEFVRRLLADRKAVAGIVILAIFVLMAVFAPLIAPGDPSRFIARQNQPPSFEHLLGTSGQGQDIFHQLVWGARVSLLIGFTVGLLITLIGLAVGMTAGYLHGLADGVLNVFTNVFLIIPALPLLITLSSFLPPGIGTVIFVLTITSWAWPARVFRSQTLSLVEKDFVSAAVAVGERTPYIIFVEILPNMLSLVVSSFFGNVVYAIGADVGLAFLGFENVTTVSWGTMLYWAQNNSALLQGAWWTFIPPGLCVAVVAFATTLMIYAVDEVTNPRLRSEKEITRVLKKFRTASGRATPVVRMERSD